MYEFNERIYAKKWEDDKEAREAHAKAKSLLELKAPLYSRIPFSWSPEVLDLLQMWEKQYGITYSQEPYYNSYSAKFNLLYAYHDLKRYLKKRDKYTAYALNKSLKGPLVVLFRKTIGKVLNYFNKPNLHITQIKEKYGRLVVYFETTNNSASLKDNIRYDIKRVSEELTEKGVFNNE